jgi:hypothetical protein
MKVGDLITWEQLDCKDTGVVLEITADDFTGFRALVLWQDNKAQWVACGVCEVISASR